ncbi:MAG TPA: acyl-CoA thioesterase domain-containing protein [Mycobacteriales bacterium]|nr:acyl-CoA thioesterase domain-containing protein [Mycobacteriales bacterium]
MLDPEARRELADSVLRSLHLTELGSDRYESTPPRTFHDRTFGGQVVAMATAAAIRSSGTSQAPHSLHGYFLRPVAPDVPVQISVETVREGRSFRTFEVRMEQDNRTRFVATSQFHADEPGVDYQPSMPDVPPPDDLEEHWASGPVESRSLGPTPAADDGTHTSTRRAWLRLVSALPDDPVVVAAMAAYVSDLTGNSFRPLSLDTYEGYADASLDHAVWFHRPLRVDEWVFFDIHCALNHAGRSLIRGSLYDDSGRLCLSMAQELLIRPTAP